MFRKYLSIALVCIMIPAAANAWTLASRVMTAGGNLRVNNGTPQTSINGTVSRSYSSDVPVAINADAGYTISRVTINGTDVTPPPSSTTMGLGAYPARTSQTIAASFAKQLVSLSVAVVGNGTAAPGSTLNVTVGTRAVYTFTPYSGRSLVSLTGLPGDAVLTYAADGKPATLPASAAVKATFTVSTTPVSMVASFAGIEATAAKRTVLTNSTAVLRGSATVYDGSSPDAVSYSWAQTGGPAVTLSGATTTTPSFPAAVAGSYQFRLTATSSLGATSTATSYVTVTDSPAEAANTQCQNCHDDANVGSGPYTAWAASAHQAKVVMCYDCHAATHPDRVATQCATCHNSAAVHGVAALGCNGCHNSHSLAASATGFDHATVNPAPSFCGSCHATVAANFATSLHGSRQGKATWYNDNLNNPAAPELQKGFGNYVQIAYAALPCGKCHNPAAWTVGGVDQWASSTGGAMVCTDCHGNKTAGANTTSVAAPVTKTTCFGCHSRQANEASAGLTDVHFAAGMGCPSCHSTSDMHGNGTQHASQLAAGAISAQCENCHGEGKSRGPISSIAAHVQHAGNIACSTCHAESMITCHNCHFDNEAGAGGALKAKFFSGKFGGTMASGNSWRFLVNRVMPDGSTKIYPGSMQSLVADHTVDGVNDGKGHTHAGIAPYYSHTITRVNALTCDKCHGTETSVKLAAGQAVRVTTWKAEPGVAVAASAVATTFVGPKGVIPVPENPRGKLLMDFVDLTNPELGTNSNRVLFQKDGPDTIHMPEAYVKPLTAAQMQKLANPYREGATSPETAHADAIIGSNDLTEHTTCAGCHSTIAATFATSQHGTRTGKATWYNDNLNNPDAPELQKGFGNYVQIGYTALPCGKCHNAAAWTTGGVDQWAASTGGVSVCTDCHGNKSAGADTTSVYAPVAKTTCFGCHSRQANEASAGLSDVHFATMGCTGCHATSDFHGNGTQTASQLAAGTITAQCENCHGEGKSRGPISSIAAHVQHAGNIACSTCHAESMITCHNCHFDNEAGAGGALKAKFFSGRMGGTIASGNSWRFLVNRVMPDGSTKIYPGSMQSLVADYTVDGVNDGKGHTHAGIAPYYSHTITRVNALSCDKCHGTETAVKLAAGEAVRVTTWKADAGVAVAASAVATTFVGPKGVIPVPENPKGKLLMDFVDLTNPELGTASNRVLFQKDGPDTIHMPEAYVKPLTAAQMAKLAAPQVDHTSAVFTSSAPSTGYNADTCLGCHASTNGTFAKSLHGTRTGKETFYNHNVGNAAAEPLQKGFGNYVNVGYTALPCADCHNPAAWTVAGSDTWPAQTAGTPVCTDCHTNKVNGAATTSFDAPVVKATCIGCHSRQANESSMGLTDVHTSGAVINGTTMNFGCVTCHSMTDMHGDGTQKASILDEGAITAKCENCHTAMAGSITPEHAVHLANIACSTCHMESVITCYGCHFDNEASDPADSTILHAKFASGKFGGTAASGNAWRFLVNRVMPDGSTKIYPASMQSLVADRTAANAPGEDNAGWTHAAIAPYYSHSITRVNALKCDKCHGIQKAIDLKNGVPVRVVKWGAAAGTQVPVSSMMATYTTKPSGVIPVPENPVGKLLMDFVDLVTPAAGPLNASGTSPSARVLFKADGPDSIHMPNAYVKPLTAAQINALATPQVRP